LIFDALTVSLYGRPSVGAPSHADDYHAGEGRPRRDARTGPSSYLWL